MIVEGDLFADSAQAYVNPVNCVATMGAGIAAQFKARFPAYFTAYKAACWRREVEIGLMHVYFSGLDQPEYLISFPTKYHWRDASKLEYIRRGLLDLSTQAGQLGIKSLAIPALGCGLGGLEWADVRPLIETSLQDFELHLYAPK